MASMLIVIYKDEVQAFESAASDIDYGTPLQIEKINSDAQAHTYKVYCDTDDVLFQFGMQYQLKRIEKGLD